MSTLTFENGNVSDHIDQLRTSSILLRTEEENYASSRQCGECTICCDVLEIREDSFFKPANTLCNYARINKIGSCSIYKDPSRPPVCNDFRCSWIYDFGDKESRPDKSGVLISVSEFNGGTWIFVLEHKYNAVHTTGKTFIIDIATKVDLPVIIRDFNSKPPNDTGDFVIVKPSLKSRSKDIMGKLIEVYDEKTGLELYKLVKMDDDMEGDTK